MTCDLVLRNLNPPVAVIAKRDTLVLRPLYGPGARGPAGVDTNSHALLNQGVATDVWVFNHDLGFKPSIHTYDSNGDEIVGDVTHPTNNQAIITFAVDVSGIATAS